MSITRDFKLSLVAGRSVPLVINANQYDDGEIWRFTLLDESGQKYSPSTGSIIGLKSDGHIIANAGTVTSTGLVIIPETEQMTASPGKNFYELLIDDDTHGTANFIVFVEPRPGAGGTPSDSDLAVFQEAIDAAATIGDVVDLVDDVAVLEARMDEFARLPDGSLSTAADAELVDIRVGADGTTYTTAGDAVRGQINSLQNEIDNLNDGLTEEIKVALLGCFENVVWTNDKGKAYYDALYDALYMSRKLISISATFDSGQNVIYPDSTLESLRQYLTVTAYYDDNTSSPVYNYSLSGNLAVGTSTITVSYSGLTTSFNVTVVAREFLISDYADFYWGWGYISKNDGKYYNVGNKTQISADIRNIGLKAGDTISIPDYSKYSWTLTGVEKQDSSLDFIVDAGTQNYTLTESDARKAAVIVIQKIDSNVDITNEEKVYLEANAKVIRG